MPSQLNAQSKGKNQSEIYVHLGFTYLLFKEKLSLHKMQSLTHASEKQTIITREMNEKTPCTIANTKINSIKLLGNGNMEETITP